MRPRLTAITLVALGLAACTDRPDPVEPSGTPAPLLAVGQGQGNADRFIVVFRPGTPNPNDVTDQLIRAFGGTVHYRYQTALQGFAATLPAQAVEGIRRNPNVQFVEEDGVAFAIGTQTDPPSWGLDRIDQRNLPLDDLYDYNTTGAGVRAYIIDTGIRPDHVEYNGRVTSGYDFIDNDNNTADCHGHGTHVAGTVGGTNVGVAKSVALVGVRVLSCSGSGSWSQVIAGIDWVAANHTKPAVANMSLGGGFSSSVNNAVQGAVAAGVVFAVAAGNENTNACNRSPASAPDALTVGATTGSDSRASFSNYGTCVDIFAPGTSITSSTMNSTTSYGSWSGTSMASPHVAGVAALYLEANPGANPSQVGGAITGQATAGVVGSAGTGSPNLLLYSLLSSGGGGGNLPPTAAFTFGCTDLSCSFNGSGSGDPENGPLSYSWNFGDGSSGSGATVNHTYASGGTRNVTLTVIDNGGLSDGETKSVTVTAPTSSIQLSVVGQKVRGNRSATLTWSGAVGTNVDVFRNGAEIATTANDGSYVDNVGKGGGSATYRVCQAGTAVCSDGVTTSF